MKFNWRKALAEVGITVAFFSAITAYVMAGIFWSPWVFLVGFSVLLVWTGYEAGKQ